MRNEKTKILDKWLIIPIILFAIYFIIRLIDQSKLIYIFPLDTTNDISSYMAMLFFFVKCGYYKIVPYWYNGYILFKSYPPGLTFLAYPIYYLTKNIQLTMYLLMTGLLSAIFLIIFWTRKKLRISKLKAIFFFLIVFANPISIGNFIRLGRIPELFAWFWCIIIFIITIYYKNKKLNRYYLLFVLAYASILITHPAVAVVASFLPLSLFLIKPIKEKIYIALSVIASFLLASFWLIPFLSNLFNSSTLKTTFTIRLIKFLGPWFLTNIIAIILPIALFIIFYYYWLSKNKSKKELLFFLPILLLNFVLLTRIIVIIPFFKTVFPDVYLTFLLMFTTYYFIKSKLPLKKLIKSALILLTIISIVFSVTHTPFFTKHTQTEENTLKILEKVTGKFLILGKTPKTSYSHAYYSYAPIYLNLTTAGGWTYTEIDKKYIEGLYKLQEHFLNKDCSNFINLIKNYNVDNLISYNKDCEILESCKFKKISEQGEVCLYENTILL